MKGKFDDEDGKFGSIYKNMGNFGDKYDVLNDINTKNLINYMKYDGLDVSASMIKDHASMIKGHDHDVTFPVEVQLEGDNFIAKGQIDMTHALIGLTPFSALGGLLTVRDLMVIKFEIRGS